MSMNWPGGQAMESDRPELRNGVSLSKLVTFGQIIADLCIYAS